MSWYTDPACEAAALLGHAVTMIAVDFTFPSGHVRLGTWTGTLEIDGDSYLGVGKLGRITNRPQRAALTSERWSYAISYIDPSIIPESEIDDAYGGAVTEYEVTIDPDTWQVIGTEINREGTMGRTHRVDGKVPLIEISVEDILVNMMQSDPFRYTTEYQDIFFPGGGDLGCDFTRRNESLELIWAGRPSMGGVISTIADRLRNRG